MTASEFNEWRKKYDFPRIVTFLQQELLGFSEWQRDQKVSDDQLVQGISPFLLDDNECHYDMFQYPAQKLQQDSKIVPYFCWVKKKKIRPNFTLYRGVFSVSQVVYDENLSKEVNIAKTLKLLEMGGENLKGLRISETSLSGEAKNFEFTSLDSTTFENCFDAPQGLNFSSAENVTIRDCNFPFLSAHHTNFGGLRIENCSLQRWTLSMCRIYSTQRPSKISESEIKFWKFYHTEFFDFFSSLKVIDSTFTFKEDEYLQYKNVKNAYTAQGDKAESGKYYYLERKAHRRARVSFVKYNRWRLHLRAGSYSKFFSGVKYKFRSKKFSFFQALLDFIMFLVFRFKIFFSPKYFFEVLKHYSQFLLDYFDEKVRGYGEKPGRILFAAAILLTASVAVDAILFLNDKNIISLLYQNLLVFIGQGEYEDLSIPQLSFRLSETLLGIFLISVFIADFSSKHRH